MLTLVQIVPISGAQRSSALAFVSAVQRKRAEGMSYLKCSLRTSDSAMFELVSAVVEKRLRDMPTFKLINPLLQRLEVFQQVAAVAVRSSHSLTL